MNIAFGPWRDAPGMMFPTRVRLNLVTGHVGCVVQEFRTKHTDYDGWVVYLRNPVEEPGNDARGDCEAGRGEQFCDAAAQELGVTLLDAEPDAVESP